MTYLSFTAVRDLGVSVGLPDYLAEEVAESVIGDEDFATEAVALAAITTALTDIQEFQG